jgi:hypothetical protein
VFSSWPNLSGTKIIVPKKSETDTNITIQGDPIKVLLLPYLLPYLLTYYLLIFFLF